MRREGLCQMEIKHVEEYEKPKFNSFQMKTGRVLMAGAACMALLGMAGALEGCAGFMVEPGHQENVQQEALTGNIVIQDLTDATTTGIDAAQPVVQSFTEEALPTTQGPLSEEVSQFIVATAGMPSISDPSEFLQHEDVLGNLVTSSVDHLEFQHWDGSLFDVK